jgi:aldehyde:ferredoxin oxidoreductase
MTTYNPLGLCKFIIKGSFTPAQTAELVNTALGWKWTGQDVLDAGARLFNFKRLINNRLGITAKDDVLPIRPPPNHARLARRRACCLTWS